MKTIMITAPQSNEGKTLISLGLIRALKNRGLDVSAFKTGPDFIDTSYLALASKKRAGNLDMHMMGEEGIKIAIYSISVEATLNYIKKNFLKIRQCFLPLGKWLKEGHISTPNLAALCI